MKKSCPSNRLTLISSSSHSLLLCFPRKQNLKEQSSLVETTCTNLTKGQNKSVPCCPGLDQKHQRWRGKQNVWKLPKRKTSNMLNIEKQLMCRLPGNTKPTEQENCDLLIKPPQPADRSQLRTSQVNQIPADHLRAGWPLQSDSERTS